MTGAGDAASAAAADAAGPPATSVLDRTPPTLLVLGATAAVQLGAAVAKGLFDRVGPGGTVLLRLLLSAVVVLAITRPRLRGRSRRDLLLAAAYGLVLGAMNLSFYEALDRIPLGPAVTLEFVGPLGVAVAGSRRRLDLLWALLAAAGIGLLGLRGESSGIEPLGAVLALVAGGFWAGYILLSGRLGRRFAVGDGLALALCAGSLGVLPIGIVDGGTELLAPGVLAVGLVVSLLSSAIPYSFELAALRRLPARVFGVLMSLEPAVAALVGLVVLDEALPGREWLAIGLVVVASVGAMRGAAVEQPQPPAT